jgi:hypothetical protein
VRKAAIDARQRSSRSMDPAKSEQCGVAKLGTWFHFKSFQERGAEEQACCSTWLKALERCRLEAKGPEEDQNGSVSELSVFQAQSCSFNRAFRAFTFSFALDLFLHSTSRRTPSINQSAQDVRITRDTIRLVLKREGCPQRSLPLSPAWAR